VARDRKRAKQRRERGGGPAVSRRRAERARQEAADGDAATGAEGAQDAPVDGNGHGRIERSDLPGALEHAGDVDEFDAALVAGAGGVSAESDDGVDAESDTHHLSEAEIEQEAEDEGDLTEDELQEVTTVSAGGERVVSPEQASGAPIRSGNRVIGFLRASWAELHRVQWPDRRQVFQATAVVIGFVAIAGAYLGLADYVAKEIVEIIL
jgi:preprotein translocase subunit SecE